MINSYQISNFFNTFNSQSIKPGLNVKMKKQSIKEEKLAERYRCKSKKSVSIDPEEIKKILTNDIYDEPSIKQIECSMEKLFRPILPVKYWFYNLNQIGSDSQYGYALSTFLSGTSDAFVIKAPKDPKDKVVLHELIIGLYGLNSLRKDIINFAYIFGGFNCSQPIIKNKQVISWCTNNINPVNYTVYENIIDSVTLASYVSNCSPQEFLNVFIQVLLALDLANRKVGFTHYDLHSDNVLVRKIKKSELMYKIKNKKIYLTTNHLATIIDFGQSRIKIANDVYADWQLESYGIYPYLFPLFDSYKLLCFCMSDMHHAGNMTCFNFASKILRYFTNENPIDFIYNQKSNYYSLPSFTHLLKLTNIDLMTYIIENLSAKNYSFISFKSKGKVLHCQSQKCPLIRNNILNDLYLIDLYPKVKANITLAKSKMKKRILDLQSQLTTLFYYQNQNNFEDEVYNVAHINSLLQEYYFIINLLKRLTKKRYKVNELVKLIRQFNINIIFEENYENIKRLIKVSKGCNCEFCLNTLPVIFDSLS